MRNSSLNKAETHENTLWARVQVKGGAVRGWFFYINILVVLSVQSLSRVRLFATLWIPARQASLSITNSWGSLKLTSIEEFPSEALKAGRDSFAKSYFFFFNV